MSDDSGYLALVEEIEQCCPVAEWRAADIRIWPLARLDLHLDLYWQQHGGAPRRNKPARATELLTRPLKHAWTLPRPADAILLGDGVSLDRIGGAWEDRYGEPLMTLLEAAGKNCFQMQAGDRRRGPWKRPTFAANSIEAAGQALAGLFRAPLLLPGHEMVTDLLARRGIAAPSLDPARLARRAAVLRATAWLFERVLERVKPRLAFTVTWYAGLGPAFLLACRRQGILSVDLQHCPQQGRHKAYRWSRMPAGGFALLPAVFWNWDEEEAARIRAWADGSWHRPLPGGHPRRDPYLHGDAPALAGSTAFDREILVALQTLHGYETRWNALAELIEAAPPTWRWWIRRHPASRPEEDTRFGRLPNLRGANIRVEEASALPLPALLNGMSAVLSLSSGVGAEAAPFGVPMLILEDDPAGLIPAIAALPKRPVRPVLGPPPDPDQALSLLSGLAEDYARHCARR